MGQKSINDFYTVFYALSYELRKCTLKPSRTSSNARVPLAWGRPHLTSHSRILLYRTIRTRTLVSSLDKRGKSALLFFTLAARVPLTEYDITLMHSKPMYWRKRRAATTTTHMDSVALQVQL